MFILAIFVFLFWAIIACYILTKSTFISRANLTKWEIVGIFLLKIAFGCLYGYIHNRNINVQVADTWQYYNESVPLTKLLLHKPKLFFLDLFSNAYPNSSDIFTTSNSYYNDLKKNLMLFIMSICNLLTGSNYYANVVLYNFVNLFGLVALYRFCISYITLPYRVIKCTLFLLPTTLFWCSGFHKEGILLSALGFLLFAFYLIINKIKIDNQLLTITICLLILFIFRPYILFFLIPLLLLWVSVTYYKLPPKLYLWPSICVFLTVLFFTTSLVVPQLNLANYTAQIQNNFLQLTANTKLTSTKLLPTLSSYSTYLPIALYTAFIAPLGQMLKLPYLPTVAENILILLLVVTAVCNHKNQKRNNTALFFICFAGYLYLFLGYTIPITGAIIRYKSIFTPLLILGLLQYNGYLLGVVKKFYIKFSRKHN